MEKIYFFKYSMNTYFGSKHSTELLKKFANMLLSYGIGIDDDERELLSNLDYTSDVLVLSPKRRLYIELKENLNEKGIINVEQLGSIESLEVAHNPDYWANESMDIMREYDRSHGINIKWFDEYSDSTLSDEVGTNTIIKGTFMSKITEQATQAKDAGILVAKITTGKAINRNLIKMMKKQMPLGTGKLLDNPLASAVIANGVSLMIKQFLPDNERAAQVSDMMVTASMMQAAEGFNVDEMIDTLLGGLPIPGMDALPSSSDALQNAKTVAEARSILDDMGIDHSGITGLATLKNLG